MTDDISRALEAIEAQLAEQNTRLSAVTHELENLPEGLAITLDEEWKHDFEDATDVRPAPAPIPKIPLLRV